MNILKNAKKLSAAQQNVRSGRERVIIVAHTDAEAIK
jgi:hypothetical protein